MGILFVFKIFLIIGLCNSSANSLFDVFLFLVPLPEVGLSRAVCVGKISDHKSKVHFYKKNYKPLRQDLFDIHNI